MGHRETDYKDNIMRIALSQLVTVTARSMNTLFRSLDFRS
jgi:hypothetical protein